MLATRPSPSRYFRTGVVAGELVVVLPMADVDVLHRVGVHREDQRARTEAYLEDITVLAPQLTRELEEASRANTVE